jgi:hypothetical protein
MEPERAGLSQRGAEKQCVARVAEVLALGETVATLSGSGG